MSLAVGKVFDDVPQPDSFAFTPENLEEAKRHIAKYPKGRQQSAVMPLLATRWPDAAARCRRWAG